MLLSRRIEVQYSAVIITVPQGAVMAKRSLSPAWMLLAYRSCGLVDFGIGKTLAFAGAVVAIKTADPVTAQIAQINGAVFPNA